MKFRYRYRSWLGVLIVTFICIIFCAILPSPDFVFDALNLALGIVTGICFVITNLYSFSLSSSFLIAIFLLSFVIPRFEYFSGIVYWNGSSSVFSDYSECTLLVTIGVLFFTFGVFVKHFNLTSFLGRRLVRYFGFTFSFKSQTSSQFTRFSIFLLSLSIFSGLLRFYLSGSDPLSLVFRESNFADIKESNSILVQILSVSLPSLSAACAYIACHLRSINWNNSKSSISNLLTFFLFLSLIVFFFPTSLPRFIAGSIYAPFVIFAFPLLSFNSSLYLWITPIGMVAIFPILDFFRRFSSGFNLFAVLSRGFSLDWVVAGHFDAFQNFARSLNIPHTFGSQFLTSFLFFVPRSLYPSKGVASGALVADYSNLSFSNVGLHFFAESWIDFGLIGIIFVPFVLGCLFSFLDKYYWSSVIVDVRTEFVSPTDSLYALLYVQFVPLIFFLVRGSFLSFYSYVLGLVGVYSIFKAVLPFFFSSARK